MEKETIIELKNIRKEFPGVVALDNVNMKIRASEVHALVGENGAGKSTLMKILSGTYSNYGGSVICKGEEIHMKCEKDAFKYGISIVAQELNYVSELSIAENLFLGREPKKGKVFVNKAERLKETQRLLDEMGLDYNPREKMGNLNVAQRQMIEILKSLSRDSRVIIMDEPTSALTSKESEILFSKVNELKQKGIAFIFISHRLEEVFELCDSYTVLRDGKWIASGDDLDGSIPALEAAKDAGLPYVSFLTSVSGGDDYDGYIYVGSPNEDAGKAQGEYLCDAFPDGASILYFTGAPNDQQYVDRKKGLEEALKKNPNIKILDEYNVENSKDLGMSTAEDSLLSYDKIDAIVCQNDDGALGVVEALKSAGKLDSIQVLGIDGSDDALQSIQDGEMTMTALQDAKAQAEAGADIFEKLKKGTDPADIEDVNIPFKIVTKDNVADYLSK